MQSSGVHSFVLLHCGVVQDEYRDFALWGASHNGPCSNELQKFRRRLCQTREGPCVNDM